VHVSTDLIKRFSQATFGEDPDTVVSVLVSFTQVFLEQYGVSRHDFVQALYDAAPAPKTTKKAG
jgi:hypothetical protein